MRRSGEFGLQNGLDGWECNRKVAYQAAICISGKFKMHRDTFKESSCKLTSSQRKMNWKPVLKIIRLMLFEETLANFAAKSEIPVCETRHRSDVCSQRFTFN